ncbi:ComEC/Rec2-related protein [Bifidobacterium commune]|uniref:ComEC/Rec2-related protein n=1 Tax=Bifidobacterium commune TaxID=1505727 RepID=A0A1C4H1V4_9BIFI|nr:ComEC/Rec2 family competence protein [Bifidobacterium commune]MBB2954769.1 ComEC/Rec2-related protein [Bifidobacterium commune]SCC78742.1 ComEC/Rec2-related protein [Bifidobacterium commune]
MITARTLVCDGERGSLDYRMLLVAATIWIPMLMTHLLFISLCVVPRSQSTSQRVKHDFENSSLQSSQPAMNRIEKAPQLDAPMKVFIGVSALLITIGVIVVIMHYLRCRTATSANLNEDVGPRTVSMTLEANVASSIRSINPNAHIRQRVLELLRKTSIVRLMRRSDGCKGIWMAVLACSALMGACACFSSDIVAYRDPAMLLQHVPRHVEAEVELESPVRASGSFSADCQANARLHSVGYDGVRQVSRSRILLYANQPWCTKLVNGQILSLSGELKTVEHKIQPLSLTLGENAHVQELKRAPFVKRLVDNTQRSFFGVTDGLSDQGRVLVPGLTIGLLGQDFVGQSQRDPVDATYAAQLETHFKDSGIMHLMAVSGGHFALIGDLVRSVCAHFLLPRQVVAVSTILAYAVLAGAMYPSDSVMRALIMGVIVSLSKLIGRPAQVTSALAWTVVLTLLINPEMSRSFGFALSCSSVLGIVLCSKAIAGFLAKIFPTFLAESISVTLAAQMFTLPIQVLMTPELPLLSVPANLIVAPFVDWSTLTGLSALLLSPFSERLSFVFAWMSSCGTSVMRWCADTIGGSGAVTIPWAGGMSGVALVIIIELAIIAQVKMIGVISAIRSREGGRASLNSIVGSMKMHGIIWFKETKQIFEELDGTD